MTGEWERVGPPVTERSAWRRLPAPTDPTPVSAPLPVQLPAAVMLMDVASVEEGDSWDRLVPESLVEPGEDGRTVLNGQGAPSPGVGVEGDFYIDIDTWTIYGPKTAGAWGTGTPLIGPPGSGGSGSGHVGKQTRFNTSAATWTVPIPTEFTDRMPLVSVMTSDGQLVVADVFIDSGLITVTFSQPQTGTLILA